MAMVALFSFATGTKEVPAAAGKHQIKNNTITIAWIPKALNNPVFEIGREGALKKAQELTAKGPYKVEILYVASVASVASDIAEQARVVEDVIAKGVDAIGISCKEPTGCVDPIEKAVKAGVEVMTWDSDSPKSGRFSYLGVGNYEGGKAAADLLVKTVACNDDINQGVQVVEETMLSNPDLKGWFFVGLRPLFANRGSMKSGEQAVKSGAVKTIAFGMLPIELPFDRRRRSSISRFPFGAGQRVRGFTL